MNAKHFLTTLKQKIGVDQPDVYGGKWTEFMYPILIGIGEQAGFYVHRKNLEQQGNNEDNGERFGFDFMYTPRENQLGAPAVVIEHENRWDYEGKEQDFSKLCHVVAPLRIFIGYCKNKSDAVEHAEKLKKVYSSRGMKQINGGETAILISWDVEPAPWIGWFVIGEGPWFEIDNI